MGNSLDMIEVEKSGGRSEPTDSVTFSMVDVPIHKPDSTNKESEQVNTDSTNKETEPVNTNKETKQVNTDSTNKETEQVNTESTNKESEQVNTNNKNKESEQLNTDRTKKESEQLNIHDDSLPVKKYTKQDYAVYRMQLVSEVMDTKIADGENNENVREDFTGFRAKILKKIYVYQDAAGEMNGGGGGGDNDFAILVFGICGVMLAIVMIYTTFVYLSPATSRWMRGTLLGLILFGVAALLITIVSYAYCCCDCSRQPPINWFLNITVTLCYCYVSGFICARYAPFIIMCAVLTTLVITLVCLGLAYTSFDFTQCILLVMIGFIALMVASIFVSILTMVLNMRLGMVRVVIMILSSVLSSLLLVIEFQMIIGGKSVQLSDDDYVYGAYLIFTSIISMFLRMVQIFGFLFDDDY